MVNIFGFATAPTLYNGILPYATVINNDFGDFATYDTTVGNHGSIAAFTGYLPTFVGANASSTVQISTAITLTSNTTVNALDLLAQAR